MWNTNKKEAIVAFMLHRADGRPYQNLKNTLAQNYSMRTNHYSKITDEAVNILNEKNRTIKPQHKEK